MNDRIVSAGTVIILALLVLVLGRRLVNQLPGIAPDTKLPANLQPISQQIYTHIGGQPNAQQDCRTLAALFQGYQNLLASDGKAALYYVADRGSLKARFAQMGELIVGPDWQLGERYPGLAPVLAEYCAPIDEFPGGRAQAVQRCRELVVVFSHLAN
jgi:hypothetical protein